MHPSHVLMACVRQIIKGTSATALHKLLETGENHTAKLSKSDMHIMSLVKALRSLTNLHENEYSPTQVTHVTCVCHLPCAFELPN